MYTGMGNKMFWLVKTSHVTSGALVQQHFKWHEVCRVQWVRAAISKDEFLKKETNNHRQFAHMSTKQSWKLAAFWGGGNCKCQQCLVIVVLCVETVMCTNDPNVWQLAVASSMNLNHLSFYTSQRYLWKLKLRGPQKVHVSHSMYNVASYRTCTCSLTLIASLLEQLAFAMFV